MEITGTTHFPMLNKYPNINWIRVGAWGGKGNDKEMSQKKDNKRNLGASNKRQPRV